MADVHSPATRSFNMSRIRCEDTKPELIVRKYLFSLGFRFRLHAKNLPGKPDIVLAKYKTVIFIHGCFWHGHENCKYFKLPETRTEWWKAKIEKTRHLDLQNSLELESLGWRILVVYECDLKKAKRIDTLELLVNELH